MLNLSRRPLGKLLVDGKLLSPHDLETALKNQKGTKELLGQALVRMGVLTPPEVDIALHLQGHLNHIEDAVKVAAGERRLLGALLVESGQISSGQLDRAIAEQKRSGDRLGEVFIRLGLLTRRQLTALLDFQQSQNAPCESPLRLGELLVATGHISREQLQHALGQQAQTHGKLGEILVAEGYVRPREIRRGLRLQKKLLGAVLAAVLSLSMSSVSSASSVTLQWDLLGTATGASGYKVYYAADSDPLQGISVDVQNQTSTTINNLDPAKTYNFAVTGYDTSGLETLYSNIINVSEQTLPSVTITSPQNVAKISGTVQIALDASSAASISKVEYYINGVLTAAQTAAPYQYSWDTSGLASGTFTIMAKAYDYDGKVGQSDIITVSVGSDSIAPIVDLQTPTNNATVSGEINVSGGASDNMDVSLIMVYANDVLIGTTNISTYNFTWDTRSVANGSYALSAVAYDSAGNVGKSSITTITVNNAVADTTLPTLDSFTLPATSESLTVTVTGLSAKDNVGVTGLLITESATAPVASSAGWTAEAPGSFTFTSAGTKTAYAWAKDAAGNISNSRSATVTISLPDTNAPTLVDFSMPATSKSRTVAISALSATDDVGVTGYLITESSTKPLATSTDWKSSKPTSFTFSGTGNKTAYAWAKDAAGNVSFSKTATVKILKN